MEIKMEIEHFTRCFLVPCHYCHSNERRSVLFCANVLPTCCIKRSGNLLLRDVTYVRVTYAKYYLDPIPCTMDFSSPFFPFFRFTKEACAALLHKIAYNGRASIVSGGAYEWEIWSKNVRLRVINLSVIENTKATWQGTLNLWIYSITRWLIYGVCMLS